VRPMGTHGPLVRYDLAHASRRFALPAGMLSADGNRFASVTLRKLTIFDAIGGRALRDASVPRGSSVQAISATGRWIVLRRGHAVRVVDGNTGRTARALSLRPNFEVDTISPDGGSLYLIRHASGLRYGVVRYDLRENRLLPRELVQKGGDEKMAGTAAGAVPLPNGRWQYTLYRHDSEHTAFVHALELVNRYTVCLDLPGTGTTAQLRSWSLALAPDGRSLYAANPSLGTVAAYAAQQPSKPTVVRFARSLMAARGIAGVSPSGDRLAFSAGSRIWVLEVGAGTVRGPLAAGGRVVGLGFAGDRLYAVQADGKLVSFDAATG
jgi:hypothetical protein